MPDIPGTSRLQTLFLRAFRQNRNGPTPDQWPAPAVLRRWLRKPNFRRALDTVLEALRFQADFNLATAATAASQALANPDESETQIARLSALMRLSHLRQRFATEKTRRPAEPNPPEDVEDSDDSDDSDDSYDSDDDEEVPACVRNIPPRDRLTADEFHELALNFNYVPGVAEYKADGFPPPPPKDSVYHDILANPESLLAFLSRVNKTDPHKRFDYILQKCKDRVCCDNWLPAMAVSPPPPAPEPEPEPAPAPVPSRPSARTY